MSTELWKEKYRLKVAIWWIIYPEIQNFMLIIYTYYHINYNHHVHSLQHAECWQTNFYKEAETELLKLKQPKQKLQLETLTSIKF